TPKDGWNFWGVKTDFLSYEKVIHPKKQEKADISDILAEIDTTMLDSDDPFVQHKNGSNCDMGAPSGGSHDEDASTELQMNDEGRANLHRFFETLSAVAANKQKISILHYGDS